MRSSSTLNKEFLETYDVTACICVLCTVVTMLVRLQELNIIQFFLELNLVEFVALRKTNIQGDFSKIYDRPVFPTKARVLVSSNDKNSFEQHSIQLFLTI